MIFNLNEYRTKYCTQYNINARVGYDKLKVIKFILMQN